MHWCINKVDALVIRLVSHLIFIEKITSCTLIYSLLVKLDKTWFTFLGIVNCRTESKVIEVIILCILIIKTQTLPKLYWLITFRTITKTRTIWKGLGQLCTGTHIQNFGPKKCKCTSLFNLQVWSFWRNVASLLDSF